MPVTRLGLQIPNFTYPGVSDGELFERIASIATTAEDAGFDSVWVMDHFYQIGMIGPPTDPMLEAYTLLGGLAARTSRVSLGAMVTGVTYRNPAVLAKTVTTLDVVSSGRAVLGIGAAWNADEHAGYGFPFPPVTERMERLEDAVRICRAMFTEPEATVEGRHSSVAAALNSPRPLRGSIPILIGGGGERRTLRLVAEYADACNLFGDPATIRNKLDVLDRHCNDVGRDPAEITKTRLGGLVIASTAGEAERNGAAMRQARQMSEDMYGASVVAGSPEQVVDQVQAFLDAGLDGMIFNMYDAHTLDSVHLAGETMTGAFA